MPKFELLKDAGILIVEPKAPLTAEDFHEVAHAVDPYISENGKLTGLLVATPSFPGWEDFGAFIEHIRFVRDHHREINRVAVVTESKMLTIAPRIAEHFAQPEFKGFETEERAEPLAEGAPA